MSPTRLVALALALALAVPSTAPAAAPPPVPAITVSARDGFIVPVSIKGQVLRLRVDPAIGTIVLNPAVAARLGLKPNFTNVIMKPTIRIGPELIRGISSGGRIAIGTWTGSRPIFWFERDIVSGADGVIGIADLPHERVTLQLRPETSGDRAFAFAVRPADLLGLVHRLPIGGKEIITRFSLHQPFTQASASAGAIFAAERGGTWVGEASPRPVLLGVSRPARLMAFATPLSVGGMRFDRLLVRTSDYRGGYVLPTDPPADPNEIVVTGNKARGKALLRLTISEDRLAACSSLSYAAGERRLTLVCPVGAP